MKRCIFTKVNFMALFLFAVLMVACTTDVYEPKPDPDPDPVPKPEVPADGSFSIGKSKTLTVNVKESIMVNFIIRLKLLLVIRLLERMRN